ncbi:hypothetical protein GCM10009559_52300 [Pseudonocardia zijingensis]|jgi:hypothetical protein|uniref:Uncharacterized protein n=1 Tax=Pseudonocardia zijingensis TaxID=153376 RepID=A0ABN1N707_9PSEU
MVMRRVIVGVAVLVASAAAVVGSAQLVDAAQPSPVTTVTAAGGDPGDPVGSCWYTRACAE